MKLGDPKEVGQMMRERRRQMGFTIEQMAEAVGLSPITIMRLELGRVGYIHEKTAKALEVPKKITKRMVMVPSAVMADGTERTIDSIKTLPPAMRATLESGDVESLPAASAPRIERQRPSKPIQMSVPSKTFKQRLFIWLSSEFERMAR